MRARSCTPSTARRFEALDELTLALPEPYELLRPVDPPEVWCSGVTYERSRDARIEESGSDVYARVYDADRPELFLKDAACRRTVGPGDPIGIRSDASWNVPEPEIGLVIGAGGSIVGYTIGNDVSSRDIEGANPLYLPQAKVFANACSIGPAVYVPDDWDAPLAIHMRIVDAAGAERLRGRDLDGAHAAPLRRAGALARPRQPGAGRERAPHRNRPRASGRRTPFGPAIPSRSRFPRSARW